MSFDTNLDNLKTTKTVMNKTRNITLSISQDEIVKAVRAESACIALMSPDIERPPVITSDNRKLLSLFIREAVIRLTGQLLTAINAETFALPDEDDVVKLPLCVESGAAGELLSHYFERYVIADVLASCYSQRADIVERFVEQRQAALEGLCWCIAVPKRKAFRF